jgi:hypothetical protein
MIVGKSCIAFYIRATIIRTWDMLPLQPTKPVLFLRLVPSAWDDLRLVGRESLNRSDEFCNADILFHSQVSSLRLLPDSSPIKSLFI